MFAGAVLVICVTALPADVARGTYPGVNGRIAYITNSPQASARELFSIRPDGADPLRLTDNAREEFGPAWSPDGAELTFYVPAADGAGSTIYAIDGGGGDLRLVAQAPVAHPSPSFSASGRRVLFTTYTKLVTVRSDGSGGRRVLASVRPGRAGAFTDPSFSPDGRWIVFAGAPQRDAKQGIWKVRRDGSRLRYLARINRQRSVGEGAPDFSPDGRRIVFSRGRSVPRLMRANGKANHRVPIPNASNYGSPSFAPAGNRIVFNDVWPGNYLLRHCGDVFTASTDGSDLRQVTDYSNGARSCPDGSGSESVGAWDAAWQPFPGP